MAAASSRLIRSQAFGATRPAPAEALLAALPLPLLVVNNEGIVVDGSASAEALFNMSRHVLVGMRIEEVIGHNLRTMPVDTPFVAYDLDLAFPGGRRVRGDVMAAPLPDWAGSRVVTVHARPNAAMIARSEGQDGGVLTAAGAAAMLAHEIKNPLAGIRGAAQLLERTADPGDAALTTLIRDEVDRVTALIDRMEDFGDTRPLDLSAQNIHVILDHAVSVTRQGLPGCLNIREMYDPSLPAVLGHRDSLVQVLINLLKNAGEVLDRDGVITLTTAYRHGMRVLTDRGSGRRSLPIEICVIDDGPGAPEEISRHLFEPFVTSKHAGRGLGLAVVGKLIADMGGLVEYAREARGGGRIHTVFRILLPRAGEG